MKKPTYKNIQIKKNTPTKQICFDGFIFEVVTNKRIDANNFHAEYHCTICDSKHKKFVTELIVLDKHLICKNCLHNMIEALNTVNLSNVKE